MFAGSCNLKYYSRLNIYKNSSDSCSFNPTSNLGYSYAEHIVKVIKFSKNKYIKLFNDYSFSATTSNHQSALRVHYRDIGHDGYTVNLSSINNIYDKKSLIAHIMHCNFDTTQEYKAECQYEQNFKVLQAISSQKNIALYTKKYTLAIKELKESKSRYAKIKKFRNLDYSEKNILNKARELDKIGRCYGLQFDNRVNVGGYNCRKRFLNDKMLILLKADKISPFNSIQLPKIIEIRNCELDFYLEIVKKFSEFLTIDIEDDNLLKEIKNYENLSKIFVA